MNTHERLRFRPRLPLVLAAATGVTLLVLPGAATAADVTGTCEIQPSGNGEGNILKLESGVNTNAQLRQNGKWVDNVTGSDRYVDAGDASPAGTYQLRLRSAGNLTDVPCTPAPAPTCFVEDGEVRFDPGVFQTMNLRQNDRWVADVTGASTHAANDADGWVLRLRLDSGFGLTDISCLRIEPEPDPQPEPITPAECRYVITDDDGTSFEFSGEGNLNLRRDDRWLQTVTGMSTLSLDTLQDGGYTLVNHVAGTKSTVACSNVTPEATPPPADACSISDLLVPSCGSWLGASTPTFGTNGTSPIGLDQYESVAGHTPDILHFYKRDDQAWPTAKELNMAERPGQDHPSLLFYNWKPSTSLTWAEIANGDADENIAAVAKNLKNYPNKLWLAIYHEPEDNVVMTPGSGMTPADYVAMFRHTVDQLEAHGVTNAVYTWNLMGFQRWWPMFEDLYPGDDVVDWVCYDPYQQGRHTDLSLLLDGDTGRGTYTRLAEIAPDKPMCLAEWGVDVNLDDPVGFFDGTDVEAVMPSFPQMKMFLYWNANHRGSYSLNTPTEKGRALAAGFAEFAASAVFNEMDPYNVPG